MRRHSQSQTRYRPPARRRGSVLYLATLDPRQIITAARCPGAASYMNCRVGRSALLCQSSHHGPINRYKLHPFRHLPLPPSAAS